MFNRRIKVSTQTCFASPLMVTPYTTEHRYPAILDRQKKGMPMDSVVACLNPDAETYDVLYAWDVVEAAKMADVEHIWINVVDDTVKDKLSWAVVSQARLLGLSWVAVARALAGAKKSLRISNTECGSATGLSRTTVSRYIAMSTDMHPRLLQLAELGRLTYTDCRQMMGLPMSRQDEVATKAVEQGWDRKRIVAAALPESALPSPVSPAGASLQREERPEKSMDIKRLEVTISEQIGYPVSVDPGPSGSSGTISYQFFDRSGLIDVLTKMRQGFSGRATVKGAIRLAYDDLDQLDMLIGGYFDNEY